MKKYILIFLIVLIFFSCKKQSKYSNPYLTDLDFSIEVNMDLPEYQSLKFANNSVLIYNVGIKGIIVFNTGSGYVAYEASDPNHYPSDCSQMKPNQFTCKCTCEANKYSLYTGQLIDGVGEYNLKVYRVFQTGNKLSISN